MIHSISIENFFSIAEKQTINFRIPKNAPESDNFGNSWGDPSINLPKVAAIYGANASGKSTVLRAIVSVLQFVIESAESKLLNLQHLFQAYRKNEWLGRPSKITIELDGHYPAENGSNNYLPVVYKYEVHIANMAGHLDGKYVSFEALSYQFSGRKRMLFTRDSSNVKNPIFKFGRDFHMSANDKRLEALSKETSIIGRLAIFNHNLSIVLLEQLKGVWSNIVGHAKFQPSEKAALELYNNEPNALTSLNKELSRFDLGLEYLLVQNINGQLLASAKHTGLDFEVILFEESQGTKNFINMFPLFWFALSGGGILIIDELDSDLHPILIPEILSWFSDRERNPLNAQLIFTAHNTALLDELEKEQVYFTEKPRGKATQVYGAKDIAGLRREPSLAKKYLSGALGAIPHIG